MPALPPQHRRRRRTRLVALTTALVAPAAVALPSAAAAAPRLIANSRVLGVTCVNTPSGNVQANVQLRMTVVNYDDLAGRSWAKAMKAKARFESGTGLDIQRNWSATVKKGNLTQNRRWVFDSTLRLTDAVNPDADVWNIHIKMTWDRGFPVPDVVRHARFVFNTATLCGSGIGNPGLGGGSVT